MVDVMQAPAPAAQATFADDRRKLRWLRSRLILLVVGIAVPLLALALGAVLQAHRSERTRVERLLTDKAQAAAAMTDAEYRRLEAQLRTFAASPAMAAGDWAAAYRHGQRLVGTDTAMALYDREGRRLLADQVPLREDAAIGDRAPALTARALVSGRLVLSGVIVPESGEPFVLAALPVASEAGEPAVLALVVPAEHFSHGLRALGIPADWLAAVLDGGNTVVSRSREEQRFVGRQAGADLSRRLAAGGSGLVAGRTVEDIAAMIAYARAPLSGYAGVVVIPEAVFTRALYGALAPVFIIGLSLTAAALVIAMLASRRIMAAVRHDYAVETSRRQHAAETLRAKDAQLDTYARRFQTLADTMPQLVWAARPDGHFDYFNDRWHAFTGTAPGSTMGGVWEDIVHPEDRERAGTRWNQALATGGPFEIEYRLRAKDGRYRWFMGRALPIRDKDGQVERWFGTCTDIHDKKLAESELAEEKNRLERLMISAPNVIYITDLKRRRNIFINPQIFDALGYAPAELQGRSLDSLNELVHPEDLDRMEELSQATRRSADGEVREAEYRIRHADGSYCWFLMRETPFQRDGEGVIVQVLGSALDITARKEADEHQQMLIRELHHRVKNILATVQAIASATGRSARTFPEFRDDFSNRLVSLGRTHSLLTHEAWAGADLHDILANELQPYLGQASHRVTIEGPNITIPRDMAVSVGMAIHELTTNAVKYGALSVPEGRVDVTIETDGAPMEPQLTVTWTERGGPRVKVPDRRGFGSLLLNRLLSSQLGGEVAIDYQPEGVVARLALVLRQDDKR